MSDTSGGTALKPFSRGGRFSGSAGSAGISITLRTAQLPFFPRPRGTTSRRTTTGPSMRRLHRQIRRSFSGRGQAAAPAPSVAPRRGQVPAGGGACPDPRCAACVHTCRQQQLGVNAVLHHVRRAPFGGNHGVVPQVPPEVVCQVLRSSIDLPFALELECIRDPS